jgi:hypothetical protein
MICTQGGTKPSRNMKNLNISSCFKTKNPIFCAIVEDLHPIVLRGIRDLVPLLLIIIHFIYLIFWHFHHFDIVYDTFLY